MRGMKVADMMYPPKKFAADMINLSKTYQNLSIYVMFAMYTITQGGNQSVYLRKSMMILLFGQQKVGRTIKSLT